MLKTPQMQRLAMMTSLSAALASHSSGIMAQAQSLMPSSRKANGEYKKEFKHNPRNNRRAKPKRK